LCPALQHFDADGSGYITLDELQAALQSHGEAAAVAAHISDILKDVDKDKVRLLGGALRVGGHLCNCTGVLCCLPLQPGA
jgi:hypothetical protein